MSFKLINYCEIDKFASQSYSDIHQIDKSLNLGDISKVNTNEVEDFDLLVGGSPCFTGNTLVLTSKGYKRIKDIKVGDKVLSHDNQYHEVMNVYNQGEKKVCEVNAFAFDSIEPTINHKFWVRKKNSYMPQWMSIQKLLTDENYKNYYFGNAINCESVLPNLPYQLQYDDINLWTIVGMFLNDSFRILNDRKISCSQEGLKLMKAMYFNLNEVIPFLQEFVSNGEKILPCFVFDLPQKYLQELIKGYFEDKDLNNIQLTSKNKTFIYGMSQCIMKGFHIPCSIEKVDDNYILKTNEKTNKTIAFYENNYIWYSIDSITSKNSEVVYDIEVKDSHSFIANNCVVHNCTDYSIAGKKAGATYTCLDCGHKYNPLEQHYSKRDKCPHCNSKNIEVTASSLIIHYLRFLHDKKPKFALYENVKNLQNKEFRPTFNLFLKEIEEYGYKIFWQVLNGKDYGIPQNRERIIMVLIREDIYKTDFIFPEKIPLKMTVKNILEENVPEKYYLPKEKSDSLIVKLISNNVLKENYNFISKDSIKILELLNSLDIKGIQEEESEVSFHLPICTASRGRNPENPNCRTPGLPTEQRLEINYNETTNTLTSVQKDNYILEETLPAIMKPERNEYGKAIRKEYEAGTVKEKMGNMRDLTPRKDGISNTLTTVQKDNYLLETSFLAEKTDNLWVLKKYKKFYDKNHYIPKYFNPLTCEEVAYSKTFPNCIIILEKDKQQQMKEICDNLEIAYRIRKLTPRECYRLMGFNDEEYDRTRYYSKAEQENLNKQKKKYKTEYDLSGELRTIKTSDAQLFKQAGNSIIVDMLYYIYKNLKEQYPDDFKDLNVCSLFSGIGAFESALSKVEYPEGLVSEIFSENFS